MTWFKPRTKEDLDKELKEVKKKRIELETKNKTKKALEAEKKRLNELETEDNPLLSMSKNFDKVFGGGE